METKEMLETAAARLANKAPFFMSAFCRLQLVEVDAQRCPTMATDSVRLLYSQAFIDDLNKNYKNPLNVLLFAFAHEVMHCILLHSMRRGDRDPVLWNIACDYVINNALKQERYELYNNICVGQYENMFEEEIYEELLKRKRAGERFTMPAMHFEDSPSLEKGEESTEHQVHVLEWKKEAVQAAQLRKTLGIGDASSGLSRLFDHILCPPIPWTKLLYAWFKQRKETRNTFKRPNRRHVNRGLYLPSKIKNIAGAFLVYVDTSGSISEETLGVFAAILRRVVAETKPKKVIVVYADAEITHIDEFGANDAITINPHGGGGTSFIPVFDYADKRKADIDCIVCLTDGDGHYPQDPPRIPTLWVIEGDTTPPFGTVVRT